MTRALLTWKRFDEIVKEEVELIPYDAPIYGINENKGVALGLTTTDLLDNNECVFFEDENGIFGLNPLLVISIEVLDRKNNAWYNEIPLSKETVMNIVKNVAKSTKNFVINHKVGIAVVTTAVIVGQAQRAFAKDVTEFLIEKEMLDEFRDRY